MKLSPFTLPVLALAICIGQFSHLPNWFSSAPNVDAIAGAREKGPLANLPSESRSHIAKLQALSDDAWMMLDTPEGDPAWGRARGRAWGGRALVSVPELRGAFFYGEGVHGFVKPDGHIMDDLWFYDINANRWIAVYPGTDTMSFSDQVKKGELKLDSNGQLIDKNGNLVAVHTLIHAWDFLTYDSQSRKFAFIAGRGLGRYYIGGEAKLDEGLKILEAQRAAKSAPPMSPWFYDVVSGKFERYPVNRSTPDVGGFANFQFVVHRNQYFYGGSGGVAYFDAGSRTWTIAKDKGPRPTGYDHGGTYDLKRNRIYMSAGGSDPTGPFYMYDLTSETWSKPNQIGAPPGFRTNEASIFYDVKNDVVTVLQYAEKKIYTYVPSSDTWSHREFPVNVLASAPYPAFNAFYDPELNVAFVYVATDSTDNGVMWAYRYKK
jgi:hypothetical protein